MDDGGCSIVFDMNFAHGRGAWMARSMLKHLGFETETQYLNTRLEKITIFVGSRKDSWRLGQTCLCFAIYIFLINHDFCLSTVVDAEFYRI